MYSWHPDDLIVGVSYTIRFRNSEGLLMKDRGKYLGMRTLKRGEPLFLWFDIPNFGEFCVECSNITEVGG